MVGDQYGFYATWDGLGWRGSCPGVPGVVSECELMPSAALEGIRELIDGAG